MVPIVHHKAALLSSPIIFSTTGAHAHLLRRRSRNLSGSCSCSCSGSGSSRRVYRSIPENGSIGEEETGFEVDRDKAREALQQLDRQLESLAQQEALPKKKRPSPSPLEPYLDRDLITGRQTEEMPQVSGSYLAYTAVALVLLTVFNNIIFNVFIKPSVDGNEQVSKIERVPLLEPTEQLVPQLLD